MRRVWRSVAQLPRLKDEKQLTFKIPHPVINGFLLQMYFAQSTTMMNDLSVCLCAADSFWFLVRHRLQLLSISEVKNEGFALVPWGSLPITT
jgi:hypothetical protein